MFFEWDKEKALSNQRKHGVTFEDAQYAFFDERALIVDDPDRDLVESRFILLGMGPRAAPYVVVHVVRHEGNCIRIISARRATKTEARSYSGAL